MFGCENAYVFNQMRSIDNFQGAITPDFPNAQHSLAASLNAGCDNCRTPFNGETLLQAVDAGEVPTSTLDRMIYDKVVASFKVGLTDHPPAGPPSNTANVITPAINRANERVATDGSVLLKNEGNALPLRSSTSSVAVIGPSAPPRRSMRPPARRLCHPSPQRSSPRSPGFRIGRRAAWPSTTPRARHRSANSPTRPSCRCSPPRPSHR